MKHSFGYIISLPLFVMAIMLFYGCEKDANFKTYEYKMPQVEGISPSFGYVKSQLLITGTDFGNESEPVRVYFGGVVADTVLMCKNNRIVVEVPEDAVSGEVDLKIWNNEVKNIGTFTVLPTPQVLSITSSNTIATNVAAAGDEVKITGSGFGTDASVIGISFNGTPAEFTLVDEENITVKTPEGYVSGNVVITINGLEIIAGAMMNPASKGDVSIFYLKNYKRPFIQEDYVDGQRGDGNMAVPSLWIVNDAAKCYVNKNAEQSAGKVGGMFAKANALGMQVGWGGAGSATSITNGKMYQSFTLPAGAYRLEVSYIECNTTVDETRIVLVEGFQEIPDLENVSDDNTIIYGKFTKNEGLSESAPGVETLRFTLSEQKEVTFGFVATFPNNKYFKISDIKLILE